MSPSPPLYLDTAEAVDRFLAGMSSVNAIALDTEGASFHRFVDRIYLLQMTTELGEAVIDPLPIGVPTRLGALLEDRNVEVILHDADYDLRLLHQDYGWRVTNLFDTRVAAQLLGIRAFGLAALLQQFFGMKIDKKHQRADWSMRPLTADMLDYAAQDTRHLLPLRSLLRTDLEKKGRWHWAEEEFKLAEGTQWNPDASDTGFLRMKGARDLTRRELARLRELVKWRDVIGAEVDRATFRVAGNEVLLELARSAPTSRDRLFGVKGFPRGMSESRAQDALQAIAAGSDVPEADLPRFPKSKRWDKDPEFDDRAARLRTVRDEVAAELDMDPGVVCSRDRMEAVARRNPRSVEELAEVTELRQWQAEVLGPRFVKALSSLPGSNTAAVAVAARVSKEPSSPTTAAPPVATPVATPVAKANSDPSPYSDD